MAAPLQKERDRVVVVFKLIALGALVWTLNKYGWESPWTLWAGFGWLCTLSGANYMNVKDRLDKLEEHDRKTVDGSTQI